MKSDCSRNYHYLIILGLLTVFFLIRTGFLFNRILFNGVLSDGTVRVSSQFYRNWHTPEFSDLTWDTATSPYWDGFEIPTIHETEISGLAAPIWIKNRSKTVYFRKSFHLDSLPNQPVILTIKVDDDYDLYLNGCVIARNHDRKTSFEGEVYCVEKHLVAGRNILAIKGINHALAAHLIVYMPVSGTGCSSEREYLPILISGLILLILLFLLYMAVHNRIAFPFRFHKMGSRRLASPFFMVLMYLFWLAWICIFRRFPLYEMSPIEITSQLNWGPIAWAVAGAVSLFLVSRILFNSTEIQPSVPRDLACRYSVRAVYLLIVIGLLAFGFRLYRHNDVPPGIFQDDAVFMSTGESLIKNRQCRVWTDEMNGNATLMMYWDGFVSLQIENQLLAMRLAPALVGILTILLLPLICRGILLPIQIGFMMLIMTWSHYHVNYSRIPWDQITVPLFSSIAFFLMLGSLFGEHRRVSMAISGAALSLGLYGYAGFRVVPLIMFSLAICTAYSIKKYLQAGRWLIQTAAAVLVGIPLFHYWLLHPGSLLRRTSLVDIFPTVTKYLDPVPAVLQTCKTGLMFVLVGDGVTPRHNTPGYPALDPVTGAFFLVGLVLLMQRIQVVSKYFYWLDPAQTRVFRSSLFWWLGWGAVMSSMTFEAPHFSRSINLLIPVCAVSALGAWAVGFRLRKLWRYSFWTAACLTACIINYRTYFIDKMNAPAVYTDCGHLAALLHNRIDSIQAEDHNALISVSTNMNYISECMMRWLHPQVISRSDYTLPTSSETMKRYLDHPDQPLHLFVHPLDEEYIRDLQPITDHQTRMMNPAGQLEFYELLLKKPVNNDAIPSFSSVPVTNPHKGLIMNYFPNENWTGDPVFTKYGGLREFNWLHDRDKPLTPPFSICWRGYINIDIPGIYTFYLTSDDGSTFQIDHQMLIDNGGEHGVETVCAQARLTRGYHPLEIRYFDAQWNAIFKMEWYPPGGQREPIPDNILVHSR
jgi:PA14 domain